MKKQNTQKNQLAITQCITKQLIFSYFKRHTLTVDFEGGEITSDAGLLLILQADNSLGLISGPAACIDDKRDNHYIDHALVTLLRQRMYQVVAGYKD